MSGRRRWVTAGGAAAVLLGLVASLALPGSRGFEGFEAAAALVALAGVVGALWLLSGSADGERVAPAPWTDAGALFERAPERSRSDPPLSGAALAGVVESAGETAREEGSIEAGVAVVRPELRRALREALVRGGESQAAIEAALDDGSWTDDRVAAAVLDADLVPPDRSLRRRVNEWLFPERAVARRTRRAVQAVAEVSDDALPAVVGQRAPRSVPVAPPTLETLQRAGDGTLSPAVDPRAVRRGPAPTTPEIGSEVADETAETDGDGEPSEEDGEASEQSGEEEEAKATEGETARASARGETVVGAR